LGRPGTEKFAVDSALDSCRGFLDGASLKRNGNEVFLNVSYYFGLGKYRLTGGTGKYSTSLVVDRAVDKDPQDHWLVLLA